jgi:hypothetical protein
MAKSMRNSSETTKTFKMLGIAFKRDYTAILSPGFLEIILNGLSTLSILSTLMMPLSTPKKLIEMREKHTMMKSMMFLGLSMQDSSAI